MKDKCICGDKPTQILIIKSVLMNDRGLHEEGETWNSAGATVLCDKCSSAYFDIVRKNPLKVIDK